MRYNEGLGILIGTATLLLIQPILAIMVVIWIWSITPWWIVLAVIVAIVIVTIVIREYKIYTKERLEYNRMLEEIEDKLIGSSVKVLYMNCIVEGQLVCYDRALDASGKPSPFKYGVMIGNKTYYFVRLEK